MTWALLHEIRIVSKEPCLGRWLTCSALGSFQAGGCMAGSRVLKRSGSQVSMGEPVPSFDAIVGALAANASST